MDARPKKKNNKYATLRLLSGLTQEQQAKELGCARSQISKWETGERVPSEAADFAVQALHYLIENGLLESFKGHCESYQKIVKDGLTKDQLHLLNNLSLNV